MLQAEILNIDASLPAEIVLGSRGLAGLAQEVRTVMTTRKGSLPLDRDFGIDFSIIDRPVNTVLPTYVAEVARQIEKYVPRVQVLSVTFTPSAPDAADGILHPVARVRVREEYRNDFL
ncbi:MAG: hypothetical protein LBV79_05995 [Candidatus Adiutrix sp.]|jgi:phage baseplate assembly protein W|nr:hypothetical protein [Candidatus Adiutrix sp.]